MQSKVRCTLDTWHCSSAQNWEYGQSTAAKTMLSTLLRDKICWGQGEGGQKMDHETILLGLKFFRTNGNSVTDFSGLWTGISLH